MHYREFCKIYDISLGAIWTSRSLKYNENPKSKFYKTFVDKDNTIFIDIDVFEKNIEPKWKMIELIGTLEEIQMKLDEMQIKNVPSLKGFLATKLVNRKLFKSYGTAYHYVNTCGYQRLEVNEAILDLKNKIVDKIKNNESIFNIE